MFVGVLRMTLHLRGNGSLKGKRRIMRAVIERTRSKFNASVAEVAENDRHQTGVVGVSVIGNDASHVDAMLGKIGRFVETLGSAPVAHIETEVIPLGGELQGSNPYAPAIDENETDDGDVWNPAFVDEEDDWS